MAGAKELDGKEDHPVPEPSALQNMDSQAVKAMVAQALAQDVGDIVAIDQQLGDAPDPDMQKVLDQLQDGLVEKSKDSQLTSGAKAKILLISVRPEGLRDRIELDENERFAVNRMRSTFYKAMGRQKAKMSQEGNVVDVPAAIQYFSDHQDPEVFVGEAVQQGFGYIILSDMSGSMSGSYSQVCHAAEMLKQALNFPFVTGQLWGFRGGESVPGRTADAGEVWLYRYDRACKGYTGATKHSAFMPSQNRFSDFTIPVKCGGLTPMNSAINVTVSHLWKRLPSSMAKRLFILTDGSPCHTKTTGGHLPEWMLQGFVAKEIALARKHGIQVYTVVIGQHAIEDKDCMKMFGPRQFWRKTERGEIYKDLSNLVLANFTKYIKARG
jgi:hypothetical protein